jgi:serine phosphatase RsbU (regulator of sigma subunit)
MKLSGYYILIPITILFWMTLYPKGTKSFVHTNPFKTQIVLTDTIRINRSTPGNPYINNFQFNLDEQQIWAIEQNSSGEMIFAHRQGLYLFNGNSFNELKLPSTPLCLKAYDDKSIVLVGCEEDYGYIHKSLTGEPAFTSLAGDKVTPYEITDIKITDKFIYFFSEKSVHRHIKSTLEYDVSWNAREKSFQNGIILFKDKIYINCSQKGLFQLEDNGDRKYVQNSRAMSKYPISFSLPLSENIMLIGTEINKLYSFDGKNISEYSFQGQKFIEDNQLIGGIDLGQHQFALSTLGGGVLIINKSNSKIESIVDNQNGLPDNEIFSMGTDKQGGLWISHGFGLSRLNYKLPVKDYSLYPGYEGNLIDIVEFEKTIYIATTQGVYFLDSVKTLQEAQKIIKTQSLRKEKEKEEVSLKKDEVIISEIKTEDKKTEEPVKRKSFIQRFFEKRDKQKKEKPTTEITEEPEPGDDESLQTTNNQNKDSEISESKTDKNDRNKEKPTLKEKVLTISYVFKKVEKLDGKCKQLIKADNQLLVATNKGLYAIVKNKPEIILKDIYVNSIIASKHKGAYYIATDKGITAIRYEKNKWQEYKKIKPADFDESVIMVAEDERNNLWVGTNNYIYYFYTQENFATKSYEILDFEKGNQSKMAVRQIGDQTFFLHARKIYKYNSKTKKPELANLDSLNIKAYSRFLISQPSITWIQSTIHWNFLSDRFKPEKSQVILLNLFNNIQNIKIDESNNLWVIDVNNKFYKIYPIKETPSDIKNFRVYLEKVVDEQGNSYPPERIIIPSEIKSISLNMAAPYFLRNEDVKYQFFIVGRMNNWSEWKTSPVIDFLVDRGKYKLKLRAKNVFGEIVESEEYTLEIKEPFWVKTWFIVSAIVSVILIISLLIIYILKKREQKLQRDNKRLEQKVAERTYEIIQQKEQIEYKNKEITDSLQYASQIQSAIIPTVKIIRDLVDEFFIINKPKDIVSGDFYWTAKIDEKLIITAADCTGHGVPGAFLSVLGITFLNEITHSIRPLQAGTILENLRTRVIKSLHQKGTDKIRFDGIDLSMAIIDFNTMELQFAGANNPLYIIRNNSLTEFKGNRMPVGIQSFKPEPFTTHLIEVKKGDKIYMFSDGFTDQFGGEQGKKFLSRNFKTLLAETSHLTMKEQRIALLDAFDLWKGKYEQIDDVLVIGVKL